PGSAVPYLAVANSLGNNVLVYRYDAAERHFDFLTSYAVGDNPVSVTAGDVNGDRVPDLLVANQGSNDVSVLIRSDGSGSWSATLYQRLRSGGSGPLEVAVRPGTDGPDLLVTNSDGKVTQLEGIGSGGVGSGFFRDVSPQTFDLAQTIAQSLFNPV